MPILSALSLPSARAALVAGALLVCPITAAVAADAPPHPDQGRRPGKPAPAIDAVLAAFDRVPLVALGEAHGLLDQADFLRDLLTDPRFPSIVDDVIVEFATARHQQVLDRYVAGEPVGLEELQQVWRDHTVSPQQPWDAPIYQRFFETVRAINRGRAAGARVRVLAADPPIDWPSVATVGDVAAWRQQREPYMAGVVIREVLARGRRGLLIAGTLHVVRGGAHPPGAPPVKNALQLVEEQYPGETFVIAPHTGFGPGTAALEGRMAGWATPALTAVAGHWLGRLPARVLFSEVVLIAPPGGQPPPPDPWAGQTLADLVDAYLYLGPRERLVLIVPSPLLMRDEAYFTELNRRSQIVRGTPLLPRPQYYVFGYPPPPVPAMPPPPPPPPGSH